MEGIGFQCIRMVGKEPFQQASELRVRGVAAQNYVIEFLFASFFVSVDCICAFGERVLESENLWSGPQVLQLPKQLYQLQAEPGPVANQAIVGIKVLLSIKNIANAPISLPSLSVGKLSPSFL